MSANTISIDVESPVCGTREAWAKVPEDPAPAERERLLAQCRSLLAERDAVLVAHYYVHPDLQDLALQTGGTVADSLEMARFGASHPASTLVVAGVRFMGETAKMLSPAKRVLMPDLDATCSLDLGCPAPEFAAWCDEHADRTVVVYANTSAAVKARADWVVTSSCALDIVADLHRQGRRLLWAPDRHLGAYVQRETGADMLLWQGACIVHDEFKALELELLREQYPGAMVLVHPESPAGVIALADVVGSTAQMLKAAREADVGTFIVATDTGMFHALQRHNPGKRFIAAPTAGNGATCKSCAHCPWMAMNGLRSLEHALLSASGEILLDAQLAARARVSVQRMLDFTASHRMAQPAGAMVPGLGAA